jgi:hypothetical protein
LVSISSQPANREKKPRSLVSFPYHGYPQPAGELTMLKTAAAAFAGAIIALAIQATAQTAKQDFTYLHECASPALIVRLDDHVSHVGEMDGRLAEDEIAVERSVMDLKDKLEHRDLSR